MWDQIRGPPDHTAPLSRTEKGFSKLSQGLVYDTHMMHGAAKLLLTSRIRSYEIAFRKI